MNDKLKKYGFEVMSNAIPLHLLDELQEYANKLLTYLDDKENLNLGSGDLIERMTFLEKKDRSFFQKFCLTMGGALANHKLASQSHIVDRCNEVFGHAALNLIDCATFFNHPDVERLQYKWHVESTYFPNCKEVLTLWFPWVKPVNEHNGTMIVSPGSHLKKYPEKEMVKKEGHLTQIEIDESFFPEDQCVHCNLNLGDAVLFTAGCAHRTGLNQSGQARVAMIIRYGEIDAKINNGWL